jgi:transcriptional regulator with XRE-family HTH domain
MSHNLPTNLARLRKEKHLTQGEICLQILERFDFELLRSRYGAYEEGRSEPNISTLKILADFHSITIHELCF